MQTTPWFDDDSFWSATYPFIFPESLFTAAASEIPNVIALSGCSTGKVLDLCCGPGRFAVPLAQAGFSVTGVDRTPFLLDKAKAYAEQHKVAVTWIRDDMRHYVSPDTFNLALNFYTSFGFFENLDENRIVLRNLHASLVSGGVLVMEMMSKECLAGRFQPTGSKALPNGDILFERRHIRDGWEKIQNEWYLLRDGRVQMFSLSLWIFSGRELKDLLYGAGFRDVAIYGSLDGAEYGTGAQRLVAVARKGDSHLSEDLRT